MKKFVPFFILIILLPGCSVNNKQKEIDISEIDINKNPINQMLVNSGVFSKSIYDSGNDITELQGARGRKFEIPDDYELALDIKYPIKQSSIYYIIKVLRQIDKKLDVNEEGFIDITSEMPDKPLILVILKDDDTIVNLFIINGYSVLEGSEGWGDYDKKKIAKAVELKDLDGNGIPEILVDTFKAYTADHAFGMVTIFFDTKINMFAATDKIFMATWKEAYEIISVDNKYYVVEANSGSGNCRLCPSPYMVRIYRFAGDSFFDIGSVGIEKEYEEGFEALNYVLPRVKKKILTGDVFMNFIN